MFYKNNLNRNDEVLLNNFLDDDFQKFLLPFSVSQYITCSFRYIIRDNFITSNSATTNIITVLGAIFFVGLTYFKYFVWPEERAWSTQLASLAVFDIGFYTTGYVFNNIVNLLFSQYYANLIIRIHEIYKIKIISYKSIVTYFSVILASMFLYYVIQYSFGTFFKVTVIQIMFSCMYLCSDVNMVFCLLVVKFLKMHLEVWTEEFAAVGTEESAEAMFVNYVKILQVYSSFKEITQLMILYHAMETTIHSLVYERAFLNVEIEHYYDMLDPYLIIFWILKNWVIQAILSVECERFYNAVEMTEVACVKVMVNTECEKKRRICKNICRIGGSFDKISVCGLYWLDASLPMRLVDFLATYTVVLLQFALHQLPALGIADATLLDN